jgi:hypothetical protein
MARSQIKHGALANKEDVRRAAAQGAAAQHDRSG